MEVELTKVSEKGQVVIPNSLRKKMGILKDDRFLVFGEGNTVIMKKIENKIVEKSMADITKPLEKMIYSTLAKKKT